MRRGERPWGGVAALLLVIAVDAACFGALAPWGWLHAHVPHPEARELGVARDRLALDELRRDPRPSVAVIGSSRALVLSPERLGRPPLDDVLVAPFAHSGLAPFDMLALAHALTDAPPDVAVLLLSEFDTQRPLQLRSDSGLADARAVAELARLAGPAFAFARRDTLLGLTLASASRAYRDRAIWSAAALSTWRRFPAAPDETSDEALRERFEEVAREVRAGIPGDPRERDALRDELRARILRRDEFQEELLGQVADGPHVALQRGLVAAAVRVLRAAGAHVLVVEGAVNPAARNVPAAARRDAFRAFARELAADDAGVDVLWLDDAGTFTPAHFNDVLHLSHAGADQYAAPLRARLAELLRASPR